MFEVDVRSPPMGPLVDGLANKVPVVTVYSGSSSPHTGWGRRPPTRFRSGRRRSRSGSDSGGAGGKFRRAVQGDPLHPRGVLAGCGHGQRVRHHGRGYPHFLASPVWATSTAYLLAVLVIFWAWHRVGARCRLGDQHPPPRVVLLGGCTCHLRAGHRGRRSEPHSPGAGARSCPDRLRGAVRNALTGPPLDRVQCRRRLLERLTSSPAPWVPRSPTGWAGPPSTGGSAGGNAGWSPCCGRAPASHSVIYLVITRRDVPHRARVGARNNGRTGQARSRSWRAAARSG